MGQEKNAILGGARELFGILNNILEPLEISWVGQKCPPILECPTHNKSQYMSSQLHANIENVFFIIIDS